jgi:hypothetical protein
VSTGNGPTAYLAAICYLIDLAGNFSDLGCPGEGRLINRLSTSVVGDAENLQAVLEHGYQAFMEVADMINVPAWRQSFIENVPANREFYGDAGA